METLKSAVIGTLALISLVCWLYFQPRLPDVAPKDKVGKKLFENFDNPENIGRVEFCAFTPGDAATKRLTLEWDGSEWRLPEKMRMVAENAELLAKIVA
ncbi:MAG: hypothetical protein HUK22_07995, partial [Thermoguttaceae bacterium]|nr:hypothetical protein [Thermoguttaceae bacterium]